MTDIEKTLLNDRQSSNAAVTAIIETAVAAASAMTVAAATAVGTEKQRGRAAQEHITEHTNGQKQRRR